MSDHRERIERLTAPIRDHLAGSLSLDALADLAALWRLQWHRI